MAENPIKYSDFIQPDASITDLISQLETLQTKYDGMLSSIKKSASALEDAMKKANSATEAGRETTSKAADDAEKLANEYEKLKKSQSNVGKEIASLKLQQQKQNQINKLQIKLTESLEGSYDKLSAQYSLNKIALNAMSAAERKSTQSGKLLEKQTKEIYEEMSRLQKATGKHTLEVGNYGIATQNLHPILGRLNNQLGSMGLNLDMLSKSDKPFKVLTTSVANFGKATLAFVLSPVGLLITGLTALFYLIASNSKTVVDFDSDLRDVGKTADIADEELRDFGDSIVNLSRKLKTVGVDALLEYAKVAGQLGVKGTENILLFTESLAKLEQATNIEGEEGASNIARLLTLTDGGVQNVADFGDEIVNLGNNFAATEKEILDNATAIAQNTGQYKVGRQFVLAYGTATKAVGLEAEITGSTIGRTLALIERAIRTGEGIDTIAKLTGKNVDELKAKFKTDSAGVFTDFISGLNGVYKSGESVNGQLEELGINGIRDQRVISSLATAGFDVLSGAIDKSAESVGKLDEEFDRSSAKLSAQFGRIRIAWDNLILQFEDGQGILGKTAAFFAGEFAKAIDRVSLLFKLLGATVSGISNVFRASFSEISKFVDSVKDLKDIEIDFSNPLESLKNIAKGLSGVKKSFVEGGKNLANSFSEGFRAEFLRAEGLTKGAIKDALKEGGLDEVIEKNLKSGLKSIAQIDEEIKALEDRLKGATTRNEAKGIQDEIKSLEAKKKAILGISEANLKEAASQEAKKKALAVEVMADGEAKDTAKLSLELEEKRKLWAKYGLDIVLLDEYARAEREKIRDKYDKKEQKKIEDALGKQIKATLDAENRKQEIIANANARRLELQQNLSNDLQNLVTASVDSLLQLSINAVDKEIEKSNEKYDRLLENENLSEEQRKVLEERKEKEQEVLEKKKRKKEKTNFLIKQGFALAEIAIEAAKGVAAATAQAPLTFGASLAWIPLIIGSAAAQAGIVIAQTIPQLWTGGELTESGKVMVNDDPFNIKGSNYKEVVQLPDGKLKFPQGKNKVMNLPKGSKVYPDYDSFFSGKNLFDLQNILAANGIEMSEDDSSTREIRELRKDIVAMGSKFEKLASRPVTVKNTVVIDDKRPYY